MRPPGQAESLARSPCITSRGQKTWSFLTTVSQLEHFSWLVVYGCSVYLPQVGHSWPFAMIDPLGV